MRRTNGWGLVLPLGAALALTVGCENLPGNAKTQGAVIGGAAGTAAGAAAGGENNRVIGALIGGALGAGGGYLLGANKDRILGNDHDEARNASRRARQDPATAADVAGSDTADLNHDGFVTMDEVVAMEEAGLSDDAMLERLDATDQVFELTSTQRQELLDRGVSRYVVDRMEGLNGDVRRDVIGRAP